MELRKLLKENNIKISKLSADLKLSRPTFEAYIEFFEKGLEIPNKTYQEVFQYLFPLTDLNLVEFSQRYYYVTRIMLNGVKAGTEYLLVKNNKEERSNKIKSIIDFQINNEELMNFLLVILNRSNDKLIDAISMYFNYTSGLVNMNDINISDHNKAFYSQLVTLFDQYQYKTIQYDEAGYDKLLKRNQAILEKKEDEIEDYEIIQYLKDNINNPGEIDFEFMKQMIYAKEDK